jgi:predicted ArsR family transcriptional regulator
LATSTTQLKAKTLEYLKNAALAVGIGDVARHLDVSWTTSRQVLMELVIDGNVECEETTQAKIFRMKTTGGSS